MTNEQKMVLRKRLEYLATVPPQVIMMAFMQAVNDNEERTVVRGMMADLHLKKTLEGLDNNVDLALLVLEGMDSSN